MAEATLPSIVPGDDYPLVFTFTLNGAAVPQTGNSIRIMVKENPQDDDTGALVDRTVNATSPDMELGTIRAGLTSAETAEFEELEYVYVQAQHLASGQKRSPLVARIRVVEAVIDG